MRGHVLFCLTFASLGACTKETPNPDAGNYPPARVIPGGGIGDGAIDGVVNLYVIDDVSRVPIPGATVRVGTAEGKTDATGLYIATGVTGPQTVIAKATGYRSEVWIGANGANLTMDLQPALASTPGQANISGQITSFSDVMVDAGHARVATVAYSQSDDLGAPENNLKTVLDANTCIVLTANGNCNFTVTTRTGHVGLVAAIYDRDLKGTADPNDDTMTLVRWAYRPAIIITDGGNQTGQDLALLEPLATSPASVDFGTPPSGLTSVSALIGVDTASDGVYQLPAFQTPSSGAVPLPRLASLGGSGYRLTAIAQDATTPEATQSIVLRRGLTGSVLSAGAWLPPPGGVALTRTSASWSAMSDATVTSVEITQGSTTVTRLLGITVFDHSASVTIPDLVALPTTGVLDGKLSAIGATGLDLADLALDRDRGKLDRVSARSMTLPN
jgi:hypothetical protein